MSHGSSLLATSAALVSALLTGSLVTALAVAVGGARGTHVGTSAVLTSAQLALDLGAGLVGALAARGTSSTNVRSSHF